MHLEITVKSIVIKENYQLMFGFLRDLHINEFNLFNKTASWDDIGESYMRHVIERQENCEGKCFVAYVHEKPVGFIFGYLEEQDDSRIEIYMGKELYISDGFVSPEFRRKGVYHKLNETIEHFYFSNGIKRIVRYTLVNNTGMRQFLEGNGYTTTRLQFEKWLD
jgi:ribosomal protein S18 acetylase RimI-like enzyme